jgi:hypothetical protein
MEKLGIELPAVSDGTVALRYCVDWTEQRHHLSGVVGRDLAARFFALGWLARGDRSRAVHLTDAGRTGLNDWLRIDTACLEIGSVTHLAPTHLTSGGFGLRGGAQGPT